MRPDGRCSTTSRLQSAATHIRSVRRSGPPSTQATGITSSKPIVSVTSPQARARRAPRGPPPTPRRRGRSRRARPPGRRRRPGRAARRRDVRRGCRRRARRTREARTSALGHDQCAAVVGEHVAVRRLQVVGRARHRRRAPRGRSGRGRAHRPPGCARPCRPRTGAVGGGDHVVERARARLERSACSTSVPSGSRRRSRWVSIATTSIRPSGSHPSPDGSSSVTSSTVLTCGAAVARQLGADDAVRACRRRRGAPCHRGPSPNIRPSTTVRGGARVMPHARAWWLPCVGRRPTGGRRGDRGRPGQPRAGGGVERRRGPGLGRAGRSLRGERRPTCPISWRARNSRPPTSCSTWVAAPVHPRAAAQRAARAHGVDLSGPMIAEARLRAAAAGIVNATFEQADAQVHVRAGCRRRGDVEVRCDVLRRRGCGVHEPGARTPARRPPRCSGGVGSATTTGCGWCATLAAGRDLPVPPHGAPGPFGSPTRRATAPSWKAPASSTSRTSSCTSRLRPATPPTSVRIRLVLVPRPWPAVGRRPRYPRARHGRCARVIDAHATPDGVFLAPSAGW